MPRRWDLYTVVVFDAQSRRWYSIVSEHKTPDGIGSALDDPYWADRAAFKKVLRFEFNRIFVEKDGSLSLSTVTPKEAGFGMIYPLLLPPSVNKPIPRISVSDLSACRWLCASAELAEWQAEKSSSNRSLTVQVLLDFSVKQGYCYPFVPSHSFPTSSVRHWRAGHDEGHHSAFPRKTLSTRRNVDVLPLSFFTDLFFAMSDLERICKVPHGDLFARNILVSEEGNLTVIDSGNPGYAYPGDQLLVAEDVSKITSDPDRKAVAWARNKLQENWEYAAIAHGL
ncbi:hypothetical protein B0H14DRAFT_2606257 [Mycena olivaceomarginata]|nr:hypothetical protein B0H14DRAFT_2606257 [Mycena olivaceomarginata]